MPPDPFSLPKASPAFADVIDEGIDGLRVAWSADLGWAVVEPEVERLCREAAFRLADAGATVVEETPQILDPASTRTFFNITAAEDAAYFSRFSDEQLALLTPEARSFLDYGRELPAVELVKANERRWELRAQLQSFFERYDLLMTPVLSITAFRHGEDMREVAGQRVRPFGWMPFTATFNLTGQPAASVPCGFLNGLPVGVQIVGAPYRDDLVLRASRALEQLLPWAEHIPQAAR